jgi:hypothetical protein
MTRRIRKLTMPDQHMPTRASETWILFGMSVLVVAERKGRE